MGIYIKSFCCFTTQALCIGVLAGAIATISTVNNAENFDDDAEAVAASRFDNTEEDGDRFRGVAWWLLCLGIVGIISQSVMFFIRLLYYNGRIETLFIVFGILVSHMVASYVHVIADLKIMVSHRRPLIF